MADGKLIETGSHAELLAKNGHDAIAGGQQRQVGYAAATPPKEM